MAFDSSGFSSTDAIDFGDSDSVTGSETVTDLSTGQSSTTDGNLDSVGLSTNSLVGTGDSATGLSSSSDTNWASLLGGLGGAATSIANTLGLSDALQNLENDLSGKASGGDASLTAGSGISNKTLLLAAGIGAVLLVTFL